MSVEPFAFLICYQIGRNHKKFTDFPGLEPGKTGDFRIFCHGANHFSLSFLAEQEKCP